MLSMDSSSYPYELYWYVNIVVTCYGPNDCHQLRGAWIWQPFSACDILWHYCDITVTADCCHLPSVGNSIVLRAHRSTLCRLDFTTGKRVDRGKNPKTSEAVALANELERLKESSWDLVDKYQYLGELTSMWMRVVSPDYRDVTWPAITDTRIITCINTCITRCNLMSSHKTDSCLLTTYTDTSTYHKRVYG